MTAGSEQKAVSSKNAGETNDQQDCCYLLTAYCLSAYCFSRSGDLPSRKVPSFDAGKRMPM
jgi:hypothetical protein